MSIGVADDQRGCAGHHRPAESDLSIGSSRVTFVHANGDWDSPRSRSKATTNSTKREGRRVHHHDVPIALSSCCCLAGHRPEPRLKPKSNCNLSSSRSAACCSTAAYSFTVNPRVSGRISRSAPDRHRQVNLRPSPSPVPLEAGIKVPVAAQEESHSDNHKLPRPNGPMRGVSAKFPSPIPSTCRQGLSAPLFLLALDQQAIAARPPATQPLATIKGQDVTAVRVVATRRPASASPPLHRYAIAAGIFLNTPSTAGTC